MRAMDHVSLEKHLVHLAVAAKRLSHEKGKIEFPVGQVGVGGGIELGGGIGGLVDGEDAGKDFDGLNAVGEWGERLGVVWSEDVQLRG